MKIGLISKIIIQIAYDFIIHGGQKMIVNQIRPAFSIAYIINLFILFTFMYTLTSCFDSSQKQLPPSEITSISIIDNATNRQPFLIKTFSWDDAGKNQLVEVSSIGEMKGMCTKGHINASLRAEIDNISEEFKASKNPPADVIIKEYMPAKLLFGHYINGKTIIFRSLEVSNKRYLSLQKMFVLDNSCDPTLELTPGDVFYQALPYFGSAQVDLSLDKLEENRELTPFIYESIQNHPELKPTILPSSESLLVKTNQEIYQIKSYVVPLVK
jgi:hypothetical protein